MAREHPEPAVRTALRRFLNRVAVVHSLPGRVRLHVPALAHIPEDAPIDEYTAMTVASLPGITSVRVSRATATALIEYEEPITEAQIVELVRSATNQIAAHSERFSTMTMEERERFEERVRRSLSNGLRRPGTSMSIPDEIWDEE